MKEWVQLDYFDQFVEKGNVIIKRHRLLEAKKGKYIMRSLIPFTFNNRRNGLKKCRWKIAKECIGKIVVEVVVKWLKVLIGSSQRGAMAINTVIGSWVSQWHGINL